MEKTKIDFEKIRQKFKDDNFIIEDDKLKAILTAIKYGKTIFATGPTGSGKTDFFMKLAKYLDAEYFYQSLNGSVCIHDLTQERVLAENGAFIANDMVLANWIRASEKKLSFLQFDEINAAKPETLLALHPIMDIKGELNLIYTQEQLKVNKNCIMVMSLNEGDEYYGTNSMNAAFINRQGIKVHFNYLQGKPLINMLVNKTGVIQEHVEQVVNTWEKYMTSKDPEQPVISTRILENWLVLSKDLGLKTAGKYTFAGIIANTEDELNEVVEGDFFVHLRD
jgi:MoxR-like ATPase